LTGRFLFPAYIRVGSIFQSYANVVFAAARPAPKSPRAGGFSHKCLILQGDCDFEARSKSVGIGVAIGTNTGWMNRRTKHNLN
jgi:hypothetical protein